MKSRLFAILFCFMTYQLKAEPRVTIDFDLTNYSQNLRVLTGMGGYGFFWKTTKSQEVIKCTFYFVDVAEEKDDLNATSRFSYGKLILKDKDGFIGEVDMKGTVKGNSCSFNFTVKRSLVKYSCFEFLHSPIGRNAELELLKKTAEYLEAGSRDLDSSPVPLRFGGGTNCRIRLEGLDRIEDTWPKISTNKSE